MARAVSMPFVLVRSHNVIGQEITSTTEEIHGLMQLTRDMLKLQWRVARETERIGHVIRTDVEVEPVSETSVPLSALSGAEVRTKWWHRLGFPRGLELVLRASDLRAFESVAGSAGLSLSHPAELVIPLRRADQMAAEEFAAELMLLLAEAADEKRLNSGSEVRPDRLLK